MDPVDDRKELGRIMKRRYPRRLFYLQIFLALFFCFGRAAEAPAETTALYMDEVVVTASRSEIPAHDAATGITVIDRQDIQAMPAFTAAEVLRFVPGVYVEFSGGIGSQATVRVQGSETRHVAVFQDGVPLNLLINPMTDLSLLPVTVIERIEIYQGAASSVWGSGLGGVINIITREPDTIKPMAAEIQASYGEAETTRNRAAVHGTIDRWGYLVSLTADQSDGFEGHSACEQTAVYARLNYDMAEAGRLDLVWSVDDGREQDPVIGYPEFWDDMDLERSYQRLLYEAFPSRDLSLTVEARHQEFDGLIEDVYVDHREIFTDYEEESWGAGARLTWEPTRLQAFNLGFDGDWGRYEWQNYADDYKTGNWAVYVNDTLRRGRLSVSAGLRYDHNRDFDPRLSPSLGMVWRLAGDRALIRAQAAGGFSAPPPAWVNDPFAGNPDLDPETAVNYQLGGEIQALPWLRFEINGFYASVDDLIRPDWDRFQYVNIDKVIRRGVSGGVAIDAFPGLRLSLSGTFTDIEDKKTGRTVPDIPRIQYQVSVVYARQWLTQTLHGDYVYHNSSFPETRDQVFVFDYLIRVRLPAAGNYGRPEVFGAVHNLFNTNYIYRSVWPQPDRWFEAGVRFDF
jgi:vitamin B12 transporter